MLGFVFFIVCGPNSVIEVLCGHENITLNVDINDDFEENEKKILPEVVFHLFTIKEKTNVLRDGRPFFVQFNYLECKTPPPKC